MQFTISFLGILFILLFLQSCGEDNSISQPIETPRIPSPRVVVYTAGIEEKQWPIQVQGTCIPKQEATISAQIAATVETLYVEEGEQVQAGDLLAQLDMREWEALRNQAKAQLLSLQAQQEKLLAGFQDEEVKQSASAYESARATYKRLQKDIGRQERLYRSGMIRQSDYEDFQTRLSIAKADLDRASATYRLSLHGFRTEEIKNIEAQVEGAQAALEVAEIRVGHGTIRSPIQGLVNRRFVDRGEWISAGVPLYQIQTLDPIWVEAFVPEKDIALLSEKMDVQLQFQTYPSQPFEGEVDVIGVQLDIATRCLPIKIRVPNKDYRLRPGMFARITLFPPSLPSLVIPKNAIFIEGIQEIVTVVREGKLKRVPVQTGRRDEEMVEIQSGLSPGDQIVLSEVGGVEDGTPVEVELVAGNSTPVSVQSQ